MLLIAEAGIDINGLAPAVSAILSIGFATWFAYYTTTTTIPTQQKEHREAIKELSTIHAEAIEKMVLELKEKRESYTQTIKEIVAEMKSERESYDRWRMQA